MGKKKRKSVFKTAEIVALAAILAAIVFIVALLVGQIKEAGRNDYSYQRPKYSEEKDASEAETVCPEMPITIETIAPDIFEREPAQEENDMAAIPPATEITESKETLPVIVDTAATETVNAYEDELPVTTETALDIQITAETMNPYEEDLPFTAETALNIPMTAETDITENAPESPEIPEAKFEDGVPILEVHFLDVDRNDAIMIRCGEECAFIDSGAKEYGPKCVEYMRERGINHLKYYIGTHAHADHVGGAGAILASMETDLVLVNYDLAIRCMKDIAVLPEQDEALENATYQTVSVGDEFTLGGAKLTCIGPVNLKPLTRWHDEKENTNSLVFRLEYGDISFLLTADADTPSFYQILKNDPDALKCTVFKNPHHNGKAGDLVVKALEAEYIVIQTSRDHPPLNDYIKTLRKKGIRPLIVSRDNAGTTAFFTDGRTIRYTTQNQMGNWSLSRTELMLKKGEKKGVARNMVPKNMIDTLVWTTSDETVAYPDPNFGTVNAVGPGECVITATAFDGTTRSIAVTVK